MGISINLDLPATSQWPSAQLALRLTFSLLLRLAQLCFLQVDVGSVAPLLHEVERQREIPRRERLVSRPSLSRLFAGVENKEARDAKIFEAARIHEYTLGQLQDHLGLHYSTISRIASRVAEQQKSKDKI